MSPMLPILLSVFLGLFFVSGQAPCKLSQVAVRQNFDLEKFLGLWYEVEWIPPEYNDAGAAWINYYHVYNQDDFGVVTGYYSGKDPKTETCYYGGVSLLKTKDDPAKLIYYNNHRKIHVDYWVLNTDYTSYAVVYSCQERSPTDPDTCMTSRSWLWGRETSLPADLISSTRNLFENDLCMNMTNHLVTGFVGEDCVPETSGSQSLHKDCTLKIHGILTAVFAFVLAFNH